MDPRPESVGRLAGLPTSEIADSIRPPDAAVQVMTGLRHRSGTPSFCGVAYTVHARDGRLDGVIDGVDAVGDGQVLVIDGDGIEDAALFGDIMAEICQAKGVAAVLVDGAVRDLEGILDMGLPVFSRYVYPRARARTDDGEQLTTVRCGGATVAPGDVIRGDETGVVVIAGAAAERVARAAEPIHQKEDRLRTLLTKPGVTLRSALDRAAAVGP